MEEKTKIKDFTDLIAWQEAHKLVLVVYKLTKHFPQDERFGLIDQLRRAVVSISSNIAEGFSRKTSKEKVNFYYMSIGSISEVQSQLLISKDLVYLSETDYINTHNQTLVVSKLCRGLVKNFDSEQS